MKTLSQVIAKMARVPKPKMVDLSPFHEALGEDMPNITADKLGRYRLQEVLRRRLGPGYRNHALGQAVMKHFEAHAKMQEVM